MQQIIWNMKKKWKNEKKFMLLRFDYSIWIKQNIYIWNYKGEKQWGVPQQSSAQTIAWLLNLRRPSQQVSWRSIDNKVFIFFFLFNLFYSIHSTMARSSLYNIGPEQTQTGYTTQYIFNRVTTWTQII